jgi:hypothetical protein
VIDIAIAAGNYLPAAFQEYAGLVIDSIDKFKKSKGGSNA